MNHKLKPNADEFKEYGSLLYINPRMPIVHGPIETRRTGQSLVVNLLGSEEKVCSFDCPYCDLGATNMRLNKIKTAVKFPSLEELATAFADGFAEAHRSSTKIDAITVSGNGEPTLYPAFGEAIDLILKTRDQELTGTPVNVLTNGANLDQRRIIDALNKVDGRMVKVDAGNDRVLKMVNAPLVRLSISKLITGVKQLKDVTVQSFFVQGLIDNTSAADIEEWIEVIGLMRPKAVHIHGMSHVPAMRGLIRADEDTLYMISSRLERKTQIRSLVFP